MSSIRRELLATLVTAVLVAGCIATAVVYFRVRDETAALFDYQLRQMALSVRDDALGRGGAIELPPADFDYAIQISSGDGLRLHYARTRVHLPAITGAGYSHVHTNEGPWRIYTLQERGLSVQVAQPMQVRNDLAARAAWRTIAPFAALLPLLAALVWLGVTRGLKPLESVAAAVKARSPKSLHPLPEEGLPQEIRPVVQALNELLPELARALETQRAFVADAAHELRTPLTALTLQLQLAERAQDDTERSAAFAALKQGLARTTHVVEQLLTLAREEPSDVPRTVEDVDMGALAAEAIAAHEPLAETKRIDLGVARLDPGVTVAGERMALVTLLSNLIDNAVRYTPEGGRVDVSVIAGGEAVVLEIRDTGPGIPHADRMRVFDRFYRRAGAELPGSGLGLAIVRSIAERHGARVEFDDPKEGSGLVVRVVLPQRRGPTTPAAANAA